MFAWVRSKAKAVSDGTKNFSHTQIYYYIFQIIVALRCLALALNYANKC